MRIKTLTLQNIRSYVEETITFPDGALLLAGDIGAGKSTLLLAIEFALFGTKRGELEASSLLRNGSHAGKIELLLDIAGKETKVCRILKRTPTAIKQEAGFLVVNGQRQDLTPMELRAKLMDILGYPDTQSLAKDLLFRYTVFTPQEQMRQILYDDKETRLNTIRKVFQMDKYKKIRENSQLISKELRLRKKILGETILSLPQLEQQLHDIEKQLEQKQFQHRELFPFLVQCKETTSILKKELFALEAKQKEQQELLQKQAGFRSHELMLLQQKKQTEKKHEEIQKQILALRQKEIVLPEKPTEKKKEEIALELDAKQKKLQSHLQEKALLSQQLAQLQQQQKQHLSDLAQFQTLSSELQQYEGQLVLLGKELEQKEHIENALLSFEQELSALLQELATLDVTEKNTLRTKETFEQLATCSLCQQHVAHEHKQKILADQQNILEKTLAEKTALLQRKEIGEKKLLEHKTLLKQLLLAEKKKAVLLSVIDGARQKQKQQHQKQELLAAVLEQLARAETKQQQFASLSFEHLEKEIISLRSLLEQLRQWESLSTQKKQQELFAVEKQNQATQCTADVQQLEEQLLQIQAQLASSSEQLTAFASLEQHLLLLKQKMEEHQQQERQQEIALKTVEKEVDGVLQQKSIFEKDYSEKKTIQKKCAAMGAYTQWLDDYFAPMISLMEKHVLLQVHTSFQEFFSKWFTMLMEDSGISGSIDENFSPVIEQNGYDTELFDLSGGEKTAVSLAYRLALNKVINDFMTTIHTKDLLILDEPTDGFSSEQLEKVRDVLEELQMKQVIIVSHEAKVESFVDSVLRIEKIGHVSRVLS
ncbi:SMC family ATPase [Candidatus Woesearchaeota archaeon]|nr:SMC family ATPase [Candidatus Woesearchaeota archaeon]